MELSACFRTRLLSSASAAVLAAVGTLASGAIGTAKAGCVAVNTTVISCDADGIIATADPGTASLTIDSVDSLGAHYDLKPATIPGNYTQTLTVTGTTVFDSTSGVGTVAGGSGISVQEYGPAGGAGVFEQSSVFVTEGVTINSHARYGAGVWLWRRGAGDVLIDSAADVMVLGIHDDNTPFTDDEVNAGTSVDGISAMTHLGAATVINRASVTAHSGRGLYVDANFDAATLDDDYNVVAANAPMATARIENVAGAKVDAYHAGARAIAYYGLAEIENAGDIHSDARQAMVAWSAAGDAAIYNTGIATADDRNAIHAMTERGNVIILNTGAVTAGKAASGSMGAPYGYSGLRGNADYAGNVLIINAATGVVTAGHDAAVVAHTPMGDVTVENLGRLNGLHGVFISNGSGLGSIDTITDTMATGGTAINGAARLLNGGEIVVDEHGVYLDGTTNTLVNTGTIRTGGNIAVVTGDGDSTVFNTGKIAAGSASGVAVAMGSGQNRLVISDTSEIVGKVTNESTGNMLELTGSGSGTLDIGDVSDAGQYQGFSNLTKSGSGLWILNGVGGSLTGTATVDAGILELAFGTSSASVFAVNDGAVLRGAGTVGGLIVNAGGTVSPGSSPGTLAVKGDVAFAKGSTYVVDAGNAKNHDLIDATGAASIAGGAVQVVASKGYSDHLSTYAILSADGGLAGEFDSATANYAFLDPFLTYDPNNVYLTLARNDVSFASEADTANQKAAAGAAESLGYGNSVYDAVLGLTADQAPGAFDALSGEAYASVVSIIAQDSIYLRQAVTGRVWEGLAGRAAEGQMTAALGGAAGVAVWGQGYGAWGDIDGDGNAASVSRDTGGFFGGLDGAVANGIRLGVVGGYGQSSFDIADRASSGDIDTYNLGAYGGARIGALGLFGAGAYGWNDVSISRTVAFPGYEGDNKASFDLDTTQLFGEANWRFEASPSADGQPFGKAWLEPFAAPAYVGLASGSFRESGSSSALDGATDAQDLFYLTLGARVGTAIVLANGAILTPRVSVAWQHAFGDVDPTATLAFASGGLPFVVSGVPIAEDTALIGASLEYGFNEILSANVAYSGQFGGGQYDNAVKGAFSIKF